MLHLDPERFISVLTTTRTPEVPSGNVFSVKTRTCLMWAGAKSCKVLVTSKVEWTGRSFIKGEWRLSFQIVIDRIWRNGNCD